ncbi:MAG TPA: hypothetical protein PK490_15400 [Prosthecobacter sp.]|nr:hypothetical protein [Prosthecobacter sp.]HRK15666.1 hypothetical protein [Prosthecobacter sp.]
MTLLITLRFSISLANYQSHTCKCRRCHKTGCAMLTCLFQAVRAVADARRVIRSRARGTNTRYHASKKKYTKGNQASYCIANDWFLIPDYMLKNQYSSQDDKQS